MSSTRDINSKGNYHLEQNASQKIRGNLAFYNGPNGHANNPAFPQLYRQGYMPPDNFSNNSTDIESALFGIGSANLVNEKSPTVPDFKKLPTISYFDTQSVIIPKKVTVSTNQRPLII